MPSLHHVVIVGAGFGGLSAAQELAGAAARITIIDRRNHHLFQPLLYQVGTAALATSVPGIAPAAKQQGICVARAIKRRLGGDSRPRAFRYRHAGDLATIGKRSAVVDFGWCKLKGWIAWWVWGLAHIYFLIGLRNRLAVALSWLWIYLTGNRSACLITRVDHDPNSP